MSVDFNPYAPPVAELDTGLAEGTGLYRDGELVRSRCGCRVPGVRF
jgi:hypothetical protein